MANQNCIIKRSPFSDRLWNAYVSGNSGGSKWARVDFRQVTGTEAPMIDQIEYGTVYVGQTYKNGDAAFQRGGFSADNALGWHYVASSTTGHHVDVVVAEGHNRIEILFNQVTGNGGKCTIAWDDASTDGLDVTAIDTSTAGNGVSSRLIASNAFPDGIKELQVTHDGVGAGGGTSVRVVGVRSWKTSEVGDPSTEISPGVSLGHDIIDQYTDGTTLTIPTGFNSRQIGFQGSAYEFAVSWAPVASSLKWTGGIAHLAGGSADANYTAKAPYATEGPHIFVDGVDKTGMLQVDKGAIFSGDQISLYMSGFGDYDNVGTQDVSDPDIFWHTSFGPSSFTTNISIGWKTAVDLGSIYGNMFKIKDAIASEYIQAWPDETKTQLGGGSDIVYNGNQNVILSLRDVSVDFSGCGPIEKTWIEDLNDKLYSEYNEASLPAPAAGVTWNLSGQYRLRDLNAAGGSQFGTPSGFFVQGG